MKISPLIRLVFWILLSWGVLKALSTWTSFPEVHWLAVGFLGAAIFVFVERPLRRNGVPPPYETSLAALLGLVFISHLGWITIIPRLEFEAIASLPCAPQTTEARCYNYSQPNCQTVWTHFEQECKEEIKQTVTAKRSTVLTGPLVRKCTLKRLDQSFRSNRRISADSRCQAHFNSLDSSHD